MPAVRRVLPAAQLPMAAMALLLLALGPAGAAGPACPVDGTDLAAPPSPPWNAGAGVDSDGCTYAVDAAGQRRVVDGEALVGCPTCGGALRARHLGRRLPDGAARSARAALAPLGPLAAEAPRGQLLERAAALYGALGADHPDGADPDLDAAGLLLRAAWAARGAAVLAGDDQGYRPRTPTAARDALAALEVRARRGSGAAPEVLALEAAERGLEAARVELARLDPSAASDRLALARARRALAEAEEGLLALRASVRPPEAIPDVGLELALARASIRWGDPAKRDEWLAAARARFGAQAAAEVERVRQACAEEARLLGAARAAFLRAAPRAPTRPERARRLLLAADGLRRREGLEAARAELREVAGLDPDGPAGATARALLGE